MAQPVRCFTYLTTAKHGFSLVELSIVLVILGLLTGGILAGQSLIKAAELRKVSGDATRFRSAVYTFRDKYFAIPGDMTNASAFWGAADGTTGLTGACLTSASAGTCNGNGDGQITGGPESYRFWQQLNLAGLLEGKYTGVPGASPVTNGATYMTDDTIGTNLPKAPLNNAGYNIYYSYSDLAISYFSTRQNVITMAPCCHATNKTLEGGALGAQDMWNIDTKLDDGKPRSGFVQVYAAYVNCESSGAYLLTNTSNSCQAFFGMGF
ncbi:MAG: type II secretion system protein [Rickettsiales bacterium]